MLLLLLNGEAYEIKPIQSTGIGMTELMEEQRQGRNENAGLVT